ncbi:acetyl-CoA carboxylase, biotin carboxyl carrier protein [Pajaroellobacter abortibovis]|uniref:Biotin carboxyl carrier protein of acetyl-CoA carboxylase n=1 Tax=Pajaroellobacter abortibovis TaxID=1882918 RepID=A0A1L6MZG1_9BACT|nr:acetyl-CoA carboxylase, biotin carboxyl carrier protein [Pajaroellobacter abortibovis]
MDIQELERLLDVLIQKDIAEFEYKVQGTCTRIVRRPESSPPPSLPLPPLLGHEETSSKRTQKEKNFNQEEIVEVKSPLVGTFYRAPSPDAPPFVELGSAVKKGQVLCFIEALKLMNEIEAECDGTIAEISIKNGHMVEFGQKLFSIRKA